jgi:hypothetical protein
VTRPDRTGRLPNPERRSTTTIAPCGCRPTPPRTKARVPGPLGNAAGARGVLTEERAARSPGSSIRPRSRDERLATLFPPRVAIVASLQTPVEEGRHAFFFGSRVRPPVWCSSPHRLARCRRPRACVEDQ